MRHPDVALPLLSFGTGGAAAMALQTAAAKRDRIARGATTTYLTGTLTDLVEDVVDGQTAWSSHRCHPLLVLPLGAASATLAGMVAPFWTSLLPLAVRLLCAAFPEEPLGSYARRDHSFLPHKVFP